MDYGATVEAQVGYQMKRVQHTLRLAMDGELRDLGLTTPQYAALRVLEVEPGLSGAALARRCFVTPQTMNQILANLESAGLVARRRHSEYGRILQAYTTGEGEGVLSKAHRRVADIERRMLAGLDSGERQRLLETLRGCADALGSGGT